MSEPQQPLKSQLLQVAGMASKAGFEDAAQIIDALRDRIVKQREYGCRHDKLWDEWCWGCNQHYLEAVSVLPER